MSTSADTLVEPDLPALAITLSGALHLPGTEGYAALATPWNLAVPSRPRAIAEVADAEDVAAVIRWAGENGVQVAVRATGHGAVDELDGALLIHTGRLDELTVSPTGAARIGAGRTWAAVTAAAAPHGLVPLAGSAATVGVVGLLTGGGLGPLARTFGLASDRVTAFDVVTGDGAIRRATAEQEPELFWGLRGGRGALGVVTAVELDLLPLPTVYAGALFFDGADAATVLRAWAAWCPDLPPEATTSIALMRLPDAPGIPAPIAGRSTVTVRFAWTGSPEDGARVLEPIRSVAPVVLGGVQEMPAAAVGAIHGDPVDPLPGHERSAVLGSLPRAAVDALLEAAGPASGSSLLVVELRQLGGRVAEQPAVASAFDGRDAAFSLLAIGIAAGPATAVTDRDAAAAVEALAPWTTPRRLPSFEPSDDPRVLAHVYDPGTLRRLADEADRVDPSAVIRQSRPLREAAAGVGRR